MIPVYGCRECLVALHQRLVAALEALGVTFEILFVNDASPDESWSVIRSLAAEDGRVRGLDLSRNFGQHYAISAGVDVSSGDWVVVMDCDLQDPPEEIGKLLRRAREGYDIVFSRRSERRHSLFKRLTSKAFNRMMAYLTETPYDDSVTHFSIVSRSVARAFGALRERNRSYAPLVAWLGFRVGYVETEHHARFAGKSSYTLRRLFSLALEIAVSQSEKPLRLSIRFGFLLSLLAIVYGVYRIFGYYAWGISVPGWTTVVVSFYFIGGLLFANLGIIGIYIGRIFEETKRRPLYVIRDVANLPPERAPLPPAGVP